MKEQDCQQQLNRRLERHSKWKKNHTAQNKTLYSLFQSVSWLLTSTSCVFFHSLCHWGLGVKDKKGASFWRGPPGFCGLRSAAAAAPRVRQRRTASKRNERAHTEKCATLLRVRVVRGREGGEWMVLWSGGGGEDGWFWRRKKKGRKERHTPRMKKTNAQWKRRKHQQQQ